MHNQPAKRIAALAWIFVIAWCVHANPASSDTLAAPKWHAGQTWRVAAVYLSPVQPDQWSAPVIWEFSVSDHETDCPGEGGIIIIAKNSDEEGAGARLCFREDDYTLVRVNIVNQVRGKAITSILEFGGGHPVLTRRTPVPFDMPVFPLSPGEAQSFEIFSQIDPLLKKKTVITQLVEMVPGKSAPLPDNLAGLTLFKVTCRDREDGKKVFTQYWHESSPWPVYGENENMKYWIVEK